MHIVLPTYSPRARVTVRVCRAYDFDEATGLWMYRPEEPEAIDNLLTNTGRVQLHTFMYSTASRANGFNYIAITNDGTAPAATDTVLTSELSGNGLSRVQGTVTLPTGSGNQTTVDTTFTYSGGGSQGVQKTALFDSASGGVMNHEVQFSQRTLFTSDSLQISFQITAGLCP